MKQYINIKTHINRVVTNSRKLNLLLTSIMGIFSPIVILRLYCDQREIHAFAQISILMLVSLRCQKFVSWGLLQSILHLKDKFDHFISGELWAFKKYNHNFNIWFEAIEFSLWVWALGRDLENVNNTKVYIYFNPECYAKLIANVCYVIFCCTCGMNGAFLKEKTSWSKF